MYKHGKIICISSVSLQGKTSIYAFLFALQPAAITVILNVRMHCEACAQVLQKRIRKMNGNIAAISYFPSYLHPSYMCIIICFVS